MNSILHEIRSLNPSEWDYYRDNSSTCKPNPFNGVIEHMDFIKRYFYWGEKGEVLQKFGMENFIPDRAEHTNSVFFLGVYLYNHDFFRKYIDTQLPRNRLHNFPFIWCLITLFHDFGYGYEINPHGHSHIIDLKTLKQELDITYDLLRNYKNIHRLKPCLYESIENYFKYRRHNSIYEQKIDHGILAGLFLYDALIKNRINQSKNDDSRLDFRKSLNRAYATIAAIIATHNIWLPDSSNIDEYGKFSIDHLKDCGKINITDSPLLFLLCLIDTIDPVKIYAGDVNNQPSANSILSEINISSKDENLTLSINENSNLDFNILSNKARSLTKNDWLDVVTQVCKSRKEIKITINT